MGIKEKMSITEWHEIEKFIQCNLRKMITTPKKKLIGKYKHKDSDEVFEGDIFMAYRVGKGDAMETYEAYIAYFNYTRMDEFEKERIAVSAEWSEE